MNGLPVSTRHERDYLHAARASDPPWIKRVLSTFQGIRVHGSVGMKNVLVWILGVGLIVPIYT